MNKFRNIIIALLILIIIPIVNSEETIKDVSVCDFFKNPFLGINKIPEICDSLDSMADYIGRFDLSSEEIENKYVDGVLDKKVYLSNKDFYIYYLYSGYKHQYLLQLVSISSNKNSIKYDIKIGMKKSEIISIFGNNYTAYCIIVIYI